jgi:CheY-like chemotaxis protein
MASRDLAVELLRRWKMNPCAVACGQQAIAELERAEAQDKPYHLMLIDSQMPDMDGFELVEVLGSRAAAEISVILMLTSEGQRKDLACPPPGGGVAYLLKPYSQSDLLDSIMDTLGLNVVENAPVRGQVQRNKQSLNILLAEDNTVNQTLAVRLLGRFGHQVEVAANGMEAVSRWQSGNFDLILMDVDMPELNGYAATVRIRNAERSSGGHIPIIGLTAHVTQGSREDCLAAGMDGYLSKPIDSSALWQELEKIQVSGPEPAASTESTEAKPAGFSLEKALGMMDNDFSLFREIVNIYLHDYPSYLDKLEEAIVRQDTDSIRHYAHTIKGMLSVFAVPEIADRAAMIEMDGGDVSQYPALKQSMDELATILQQHLSAVASRHEIGTG